MTKRPHPTFRAAAIFLVVLAWACARQEPIAPFDPSRDAAKDVADASALAKTQGKRVMVDVGGEWCSWCHTMDNFIAANADLKSLIDSRYIWVKVNFSKENKNEAFLTRWPKIEGYPHLFVLDGDGHLLHSQDTGELEAGESYDKAKFLAFAQKWGS
ncbi:MAG TPA: thioredoxin family protein [Casimicrobiaceae bacterium]|jgi:thioredoxin-related protein